MNQFISNYNQLLSQRDSSRKVVLQSILLKLVDKNKLQVQLLKPAWWWQVVVVIVVIVVAVGVMSEFTLWNRRMLNMVCCAIIVRSMNGSILAIVQHCCSRNSHQQKNDSSHMLLYCFSLLTCTTGCYSVLWWCIQLGAMWCVIVCLLHCLLGMATCHQWLQPHWCHSGATCAKLEHHRLTLSGCIVLCCELLAVIVQFCSTCL